MNKDIKISDALTWDEVGKLYGKYYATKSMDSVFEAVKERGDIFFNEKEGTLHKIIKETEQSSLEQAKTLAQQMMPDDDVARLCQLYEQAIKEIKESGK